MRRLLILVLLTASLDAADKPNILFIYTDDQAGWALGLSGHPHASTPNMDKLFRRGAYLPNSFTVTPVCTPSRTSLITSRYGSELGLTDWLNPRREPFHGLDSEALTWPELLDAAGYATGLVGKWHLGLKDEHHPTPARLPTLHGFSRGRHEDGRPRLGEGRAKSGQFHGLTADILTTEAISFLERERDGPFALSLHYRAPHTRWLPVAPEDWEPFEGLNPVIPNPDFPYLDLDRVRRMTREYLASTKSVDSEPRQTDGQAGRAGTDARQRSSSTRATTATTWVKAESGTRATGITCSRETLRPQRTSRQASDRTCGTVPFVSQTAVGWPGRIEAGPSDRRDRLEPRLVPDPLPPFPARIFRQAQSCGRGRDLLPLLLGTAERWNNDLYGEYSTHHQSRTHMRMLRTPRWKLVRDFLNPERNEFFYDLKADPEETTNLIYHPKAQDVIGRLR